MRAIQMIWSSKWYTRTYNRFTCMYIYMYTYIQYIYIIFISMDTCMWYAPLNQQSRLSLCTMQFRSGTINRGAAAERLERSVGPGRGVSGSFGAVQWRWCRGAFAGMASGMLWQWKQSGIDREKPRSTPKVVPGAAQGRGRRINR